MQMRRAAGLAAIGLLMWIGAWPAAAAPRVVATLAPAHSLVAGVMEGVGEPHLLIRGGASPHDFVLRPSDRRELGEAQLVFWVGEGMETFLPKVLGQLGAKVRIVALAELPGVEHRVQRSGGIWAAHGHPAPGHAHEEEHADHAKEHAHAAEASEPRHETEHAEHSSPAHDEHAHQESAVSNMHLWLDPHNAGAWVAGIVEALSAVDPPNATRYRENGERLQDRLRGLDAELKTTLAPVRAVPYVVFHDAFHYLEARYGLAAAGSISLGDGLAPGARRLIEIRDLLQARGARCIFAEPQFEPRAIRTVAEGTDVKVGELDPLGARLIPGPELYFDLMRGLARNLVDCLR